MIQKTSFPVEIICAALNFTKLDEDAFGTK